MTEVDENEYNDYINALILPTVDIIDDCGMINTKHFVLDKLKAKKTVHNFVGTTIYKVKK